jgi:hypothetical protein
MISIVIVEIRPKVFDEVNNSIKNYNLPGKV